MTPPKAFKRNATAAGLDDLKRPQFPPSSRNGVPSTSSMTSASVWGTAPGENASPGTFTQSTSPNNAPPPSPSSTLIRPVNNSTQSHNSNQNQEFTTEQARIFRLVQREDPSDSDYIKGFIKGSLEYKLSSIMKGILHNKREIAQVKNEAKATKRDAELRGIIRPLIRQRLTLERYKDSAWNDPKPNTFLTSLRSSLPSDLDLPENAATIVGKVRIEEKAKLKDRLQKCREFVHLPLMEFAECLRTEGDSDTKHVEDGVPLWEAAACWRYVVLEMSQARDGNFWSAVDKILAPVDVNWDFYSRDIETYGHASPGDSSTFDHNPSFDPPEI